MIKPLILTSFLIFSFTSLALADTSSCTDTGIAITCNLFENAADYSPSGLLYAVASGPQTPGYVVLMDSGDPSNTTDQANRSLWSDVLFFQANTNSNTGSTRLTLYFDPNTFPSANDVINNPFSEPVFLTESKVSPFETTYTAPGNGGTNTYNIFSPPPSAVPEPSGYAILVTGLVGMGALLRRLRAKAVPAS